MSDTIQLNLWDWLEEAALVAAQMPQLVAVSDGVAALDEVMDTLTHQPIPDQLKIAAEAFAQLSAILERKSEQWLTTWDAAPAGGGLALEPDWMAGLVRQPVSFDLSDLVEVPQHLEPPKRQRPTADSSWAAPVEPAKLLNLLEQLAQDPEFVQTQLALLAGGEEPGRWQETIEENWQDGAQISFCQLQQQTGLAPVELWLGLLLGSYRLSAQAGAEQFYQSDFWVKRG